MATPHLFMERMSPSGRLSWANYCGPSPPTYDCDDKLRGAWAECLESAVLFEIQCPDFADREEYADNGPVGHVIDFATDCGYDAHVEKLQAAEQQFREAHGAEPDEIDQFAFMQFRCPTNGKTWMEFCRSKPPSTDAEGFVNGPWGACLTQAVVFENQFPGWEALPMFKETGPAGQVLEFMHSEGFEDLDDALQKTEEATKERLDDGGKIPVFQGGYQPMVGTEEAEVSDESPDVSGRKKALFVGINYFGSSAELGGCINDVHTWKGLLMEMYGFEEQEIVILTDDAENPRARPTLENIKAGMRWLAAGASKGDVLFFQYSGHGTQVPANDDSQEEIDGKDEALCPCDYANYNGQEGFLVDDEIFELLVRPIPAGVKLTIVLDCCHSGTAVDLPFMCLDNEWQAIEGTIKTAGDVQMFSGCMDDQTSADVQGETGREGAMTAALTTAIRENRNMTYPDMLQRCTDILVERGMTQRPRLTSSQQFDTDGREFDLVGGIIPNHNETLGLVGRPRHHPPRVQPVPPGHECKEGEPCTVM